LKLEELHGCSVIDIKREQNMLTIRFTNNKRLEAHVVIGDDGLYVDLLETRTVEEIVKRESF
jgi:hypothetical protein